MEQGTAGVKPGQGTKPRETACERCGALVRWSHVEGGSVPLVPEVVWVRRAAHIEDSGAHLEVIFASEDSDRAKKGQRVVGVSCSPTHPGAIAGRWRHQCAGEGGGGQALQIQLARELAAGWVPGSAALTGGPLTTLTGGPSTTSSKALGGAQRERLAEILRDALEDALDALGRSWAETERGVVITPRLERDTPEAARIARLCEGVRLAEGIEAGRWMPRRARGGV